MSVRFCVIGCGAMSSSVHGPSHQAYAAEHPECRLAACCDLDLARAEVFRERFGFGRSYRDFLEMLEQERPDAVAVLVSEAASCAVGCEVLRRGIPLLIEKPPGKTAAETLRLDEAARAAGTPCMVAFNRRTMPLVQIARAWIAACAAPVQFVGYDFFRVGRNDPDFSDTAVHAFDTARLLCGADYGASVEFDFQEIPKCVPKNVCLSAIAQNGARIRIQIFPNSGVLVERATIHCGNHTFFLQLPIDDQYDGAGSLTELHQGRVFRQCFGKNLPGFDQRFINSGFYEETRQFLEAVQAGTLGCFAFQDALPVMKLKERYKECLK